MKKSLLITFSLLPLSLKKSYCKLINLYYIKLFIPFFLHLVIYSPDHSRKNFRRTSWAKNDGSLRKLRKFHGRGKAKTEWSKSKENSGKMWRETLEEHSALSFRRDNAFLFKLEPSHWKIFYCIRNRLKRPLSNSSFSNLLISLQWKILPFIERKERYSTVFI